MTKKQWSSIRIGTKVWKQHTDLKWVGQGVRSLITQTVYLTGVVKRINSNHSQVLVDWGDNEIWYGRLGIELVENKI